MLAEDDPVAFGRAEVPKTPGTNETVNTQQQPQQQQLKDLVKSDEHDKDSGEKTPKEAAPDKQEKLKQADSVAVDVQGSKEKEEAKKDEKVGVRTFSLSK